MTHNIVLIDDNEIDNMLICRHFDHINNSLEPEQNIKVYDFTSAAEGLAYLCEHSPSLLILDINLPDIDAIELLKALKKQTSSYPPILLITGLSDKNLRPISKLGRAMGFDILNELEKPVSLTELKTILSKICNIL